MQRLTGALIAIAMAAVPGAAPAAGAKASGADDGSKRICRIQATTGWRTRATRICRTRAEWEQLARQTDQDVRDMRRRRSGAE